MLRITWGVCAGLMLSLLPAGAHDLKGLMTEKNIPQEILDQINDRSRFRYPALREHVFQFVTTQQAPTGNELTQFGLSSSLESSIESIVLADAKWDRGATLTLCFFDGNQTARKNVVDAAREIFILAELTLDYGSDDDIRTCDLVMPSNLRVAFNTDGYWSYIGNDALLIPPVSPTIGLENLHLFMSLSDDQRGTVRHEFMHAIAFLHDHQHSQSNCNKEFNWAIIYDLLPWPKEQVDFNLKPISELSQFAGLTIVQGKYDPTSIMHYSLSAAFFLDPATATCLVPENTQLSDEDRRMVREMYVDP